MSNNDRRTCDIVMKGGITSGVVYPRAISNLAKKFRFVNIGGTSAGAIAAAVTAAAEYRRQTAATEPDAGFDKIDGLGATLIEKVGAKSTMRLLSLFTPNKGMTKLFNVLLACIGHDSGLSAAASVLFKLLGSYWWIAAAGSLPGVLLAYVSSSQGTGFIITGIWVAIAGIMAICGAILAPAIWLAFVFVIKVPNNYFGICSGMPDEATPDGVEPLTAWLNDYINDVAGIKDRKEPLTFADLYSVKDEKSGRLGINLEMMTTNLTHGRPYRLPFKDNDDLKENHLFFFNEDEFLTLFPKKIVDHMVKNVRPVTLSDGRMNKSDRRETRKHARYKLKGYYAMPRTEQLPVVVATRMSLSFPILLSAIPLYSLVRHPSKKGKPHSARKLKRCWFTDGGFCSNLPMHFFDGPIPKRPTFSLDLVQVPDNPPGGGCVPTMDANNGFAVVEHWNQFDVATGWNEKDERPKSKFGQLFGFGNAMLETMRNWNDATQSRLPGYRDRIVTIPLTSKEGGLNLDMDEAKVERLVNQGLLSSEQLIERFHPQNTVVGNGPNAAVKMNWNNHRWVRLRSQMAAMEKMLDSMRETWNNSEAGDPTFKAWLAALVAPGNAEFDGLSYQPTKKQIKSIIDTMELLEEYPNIWNGNGSAAANSPRPRTELRHRAQI